MSLHRSATAQPRVLTLTEAQIAALTYMGVGYVGEGGPLHGTEHTISAGVRTLCGRQPTRWWNDRGNAFPDCRTCWACMDARTRLVED